MDISHIFRSYDIRGIYGKDLNEEIMRRIGNAFGQLTKTDTIVIARDCRLSSESLKDAFVSGLLSSGKNVIDVGLLPLGVGMFHAWQNKMEFAYITASHLPKEWNGVKFFHANGVGYFEEENLRIRDTVLANTTVTERKGSMKTQNNREIIEDYKTHLLSKIKANRKMPVTLDCGNGCAGLVVKDLFDRAGFETAVLFEDADGEFPNRSPDPAEDPLTELKKASGIGIAYDNDGDRMLLVHNGQTIQQEETAYIILSELLKKEKGPVVANIECTRLIDEIAKKFGREVIRVPVGHTFLVQAVAKNKACFGVELSGHYIIPSLVPVDDTLAASLYAAQIISEIENLDQFLANIPEYPFERINFPCEDEKKFEVVKTLQKQFRETYNEVSTLDGVRVDFPAGWVLVRAANTSPFIRLSIEASNVNELENLKNEFVDIVAKEIERYETAAHKPTVKWNNDAKLIVSDVDSTVAATYENASDEMIKELEKLLGEKKILFLITGQNTQNLQRRITHHIKKGLRKQILLGHCNGTELWGFDPSGNLCEKPFYSLYTTLSDSQKTKFREIIKQLIAEFKFDVFPTMPTPEFKEKTNGNPLAIMLDDRGSQITFEVVNNPTSRNMILERAERLFQESSLPITPRLGGTYAIDFVLKDVSKATAIKYVMENDSVLSELGLNKEELKNPRTIEVWGDKFSIRASSDRHMSEALPKDVRSITFCEEDPAEFPEGYNIVVWDGKERLHSGLLEFLKSRH